MYGSPNAQKTQRDPRWTFCEFNQFIIRVSKQSSIFLVCSSKAIFLLELGQLALVQRPLAVLTVEVLAERVGGVPQRLLSAKQVEEG